MNFDLTALRYDAAAAAPKTHPLSQIKIFRPDFVPLLKRNRNSEVYMWAPQK